MKRKRRAISGQEIVNQVGKQIIFMAAIQCEGKMYCGTCVEFFLFFFVGLVACPCGLVIFWTYVWFIFCCYHPLQPHPQGFATFSSIGHVRYVWPRRDGTGSNTPSRGRVDYLAYGGYCFGVLQPKI